MKKYLFVDRDGTLIVEPPDQQIDAYSKLALLPGVIPALRRCVEAGYELVMVTNQDGLGTASFPEEQFWGPHRLMLQIFESQGVRFADTLIDRSFAHEGLATRKPGTGLMRSYLGDDGWNRGASAMVGDRVSDIEFAANLGVRGFHLGGGEWDWDGIARTLCEAPRRAETERVTRETRIRVRVDLDRSADPVIATGVGFFDHMLEQIGKHAGITLSLQCAGDTHIDEHHTVEDCALALGQALRSALADKRGIGRYGDAYEPQTAASVAITLPMDESLARAALDLSGRPYFVFDGAFPREHVGDLPTELVPHFFRSLCETLGANLHLAVRGDNTHHMVEASFKAVARALRQALRREGSELPSTKGAL
ncbi:MAG: bifunctional histidinol-phosphatase/imidazoleglycerol-phosphate dehydratase HisB [Rhodanobacteraceae bacterium]|nr:bifunctional histidinol-phosphatase/imidazoleglycerol-phosphate dehydratase HisB [Rhodanobacteraceae bacterium]